MSTQQIQSSPRPRPNERTTRVNRDTVCAGKRYGITHDGHDVELEFNQKLVVLNRARLAADGEIVDTVRMMYGHSELTTTLQDATAIVVKVDCARSRRLCRRADRAGPR